MKNATKGKIIKGAAIAIDVAVPLVATLTQFPIWVEKSSEATVSGLFLVFAVLAVIPLFKQIKEFMKSPSVWILWCVLFVLFVVLQNIIAEMVKICFAGMIANIIGAGIYKLGAYIGSKEDSVLKKEE